MCSLQWLLRMTSQSCSSVLRCPRGFDGSKELLASRSSAARADLRQASGLESTLEWSASGFQVPTEFRAEIKNRRPGWHLFVVVWHGNCELRALLGVIDATFGDDVVVSPIVGHREMCNRCAIPKVYGTLRSTALPLYGITDAGCSCDFALSHSVM